MHSPADSPDVLLSYAPADAEWTETWLLPQLEGHGLEVFVANRDMLAGGARLEQLAEKASKARHTLLVLSPNWVDSQWEGFIGLFSHSTDPLGRNRKTIPILRERCKPPRSISRLVHADFTSKQKEEWDKQFSRLLAVLDGKQYRTALGPPLGALLGLESPTNFIYRKNDHFVGRERELAELHELLDDSAPVGVNAARPDIHASSRLAGLTGLGGVGKTQLVVEYIYRYRQAYPGGVFWVNAADGLEQGLVSIGKVLDPNWAEKNDIELVKTASDYLSSDPDTLLVLDNLNDPALLNQPVMGVTAPRSYPCRVLFTTRRRDLRGLRAIAVDVLGESDALGLLLRARPEIKGASHPEHSLAVKVCATLGGLPLAIEMAASYLEQEPDVTLSGYLNRLGKYGTIVTVDSLEQAQDWSPTWHDPVQVTLQSQWDAIFDRNAQLVLQVGALMPEAEAIPIARLDLLTGLSRTAEEGFPSPLRSSLRSLYNFSMIEQLEEGKQVRLHPLVREFVRTQIESLDDFANRCSSNMGTALENMLRVDKEIFERGVDAVLTDLQVGINLGSDPMSLRDLMLVLDKEAHNLRKTFSKDFPGYILQQIRRQAFNLHKMTLKNKAEVELNTLGVPWFQERFHSSRVSFSLLRTFEGHTDQIRGLTIMPDGQHAISTSLDKTLRLWNLESGRLLRTFEGHQESVWDVAITADGKRVISASWDKTLRLWSLEDGRCLRIFEGHSEKITHMAITPNGKRVISTTDSTSWIWALDNGQSVSVFKKYRVDRMAILPDSKRILFSSDRTLYLWDLENDQLIRSINGHTERIIHVEIMPDGEQAISASQDNTLRLWDLKTGQCLRRFEVNMSMWDVHHIAITPDGNRALIALGNTLHLWDLENNQLLNTFDGHGSYIQCVSITPDGKCALSGSNDKTLRLWDIESYNNSNSSKMHTDSVEGVALLPDGKSAITASQDKTLHLWDLNTGKVSRVFTGHTLPVQGVAVTPDGKYALSSSWDGTLRLWNLENGQSLYSLTGHNGQVHGVAITPNGEYAISGGGGGVLCLWNLETGKLLRAFKGHSGLIKSIAITADGKFAISASEGYTLRRWDLKTFSLLNTYSGHTRGVKSVAISPDGKRAISASADGTLCLWDVDNGQKLHTFEGHTDIVWSVVTTPDSKYIISVSWDKNICLWDIDRCERVQVFAIEMLNCVSIDKTGKLIVVGSTSGSVYFIDLIFGTSKN